MRARVLWFFVALLPLGCALSTEPEQDRHPALQLDLGTAVVFRAEHAEYSYGDTAMIVLRNDSDQPLGYNLCFSARELRTASGWRRFVPLRICTAALDILDPGAETVLWEPISVEWEPGEYRMVTTLELMRAGIRGEVSTPPFTVRP